MPPKRRRGNGHSRNNSAAQSNGHINGNTSNAKIHPPPKGAFGKIKPSPIDWEIPRKSLHTSIGFMAFFGWTQNVRPSSVVLNLSVALVIIFLVDLVRLSVPSFARFWESQLGFLMRQSEKNKLNGVIWYLIGAITVLTFLPRDLSVLSIALLSWADTSASVFGRLFGRYTPSLPTFFAPRKSLAGLLASILTGALTSYIFWVYLAPLGDHGDLSWIPASSHTAVAKEAFLNGMIKLGLGIKQEKVEKDWWKQIPRLPNPKSNLPLEALCVLTGVVAGLAEAKEVGGLDDNLTLPILAGFGTWAAMYALP